jgi:hypothetical protein
VWHRRPRRWGFWSSTLSFVSFVVEALVFRLSITRDVPITRFAPLPLLYPSQIGVDLSAVIPRHPRLAWVSAIALQLAWGSEALLRVPSCPLWLWLTALQPSACVPQPKTPHSTLLQTKAQPRFDRTVDRTVEAFFRVFQRSNLAQFHPSFFVFTVRSAEGRKSI